MISEGYQKT